jgi:hypothetical protein
MRTQQSLAALALIAIAACGGSRAGAGGMPATQQFTRRVDATPGRVVAATLATFSRYGIPVESADETKGEVHSVPLDLRGNWGPTPTLDRVNCPGGEDTTAARVTFDVKAKPADSGSLITLNARRSGGERCVVRASFVTELLDAIAQETRSR